MARYRVHLNNGADMDIEAETFKQLSDGSVAFLDASGEKTHLIAPGRWQEVIIEKKHAHPWLATGNVYDSPRGLIEITRIYVETDGFFITGKRGDL